MPSACLLVSHGSRDPRPEIAMQRLAELVCGKLELPSQMVGTAYLELHPQPLHQQIKDFALQVYKCGCHDIIILPLFLLPGVHVMEDIPQEVELARQMDEDIKISLKPYLGSDNILPLLAKQIANINVDKWIVLAHGSRRPLSQELVEAIATSLDAVAAYWSIPPSLETQVHSLVNYGYKHIGILPYFLFSGGITDAIAQSTQALRLQFPSVSFQLTEPFGATTELADLIGDMLRK
jgi:sirohydrochlorin ferrochelatase